MIKPHTSSGYQHTAGMATQPDAGMALAHNLQRLMDHLGLSQAELGRRTGIAQRTISTLLDKKNAVAINPQIKTLQLLGSYFKLQPWQLLIPDMPLELLVSDRIAKLVVTYRNATPEARSLMELGGERKAGAVKPPRSSAPVVDQRLLASALTAAMTVFRAHHRLPTETQIAAAVAYIYSHVQAGKRMRDAVESVQSLLARAGDTVPDFK